MKQLTKNEITRIIKDARVVVSDISLFSKLCSLEQLHDADAAPDWLAYDETIRQIFSQRVGGLLFEIIATRRAPFGFSALHKTTGQSVAFFIRHDNLYDLVFSFGIIK